ncbi:SpoIIE family protein phosphatase [Adhaeribacter sp. BT258]|uniref:SpoIIE family protein phosphatase n=1 Tax=Adhaeribacter terrigena TaxID=2793070 RepID=A0ABS1BZL2_9BACT|nr:ATP-binding protein [Adhaeribacter terrigena]MBK0402352.1 SpoIIE family protein phosphatase [Adhaeribacter terrigena]
MDVKQHQRFIIADRSYLNLVKRDITKLAENYGFSENEIGKINIVVSEMVSNLVKHTSAGGEVLVKPVGDDLSGIEIISIDYGPGMVDPERMMEDGVSTHGTAGQGLGAIIRQSAFFDYYTLPESGTVLLSRIFKQVVDSPFLSKPIPKPEKLEVGAIMVAKNGETVCGDGWEMAQTETNTYIVAFDGLGHGPDANAASTEAIKSFKQNLIDSPSNALRQIHADIRRTRGAVGAVCNIHKATGELDFCGIGNINGKIFGSNGQKTVSVLKNLVSYNGTLGHNIPNTMHDLRTEIQMGQLLVLHSDGIKSRWDVTKYPDLHRHDPSLIAAIIYRDFNRGTDDVLVIVAKAKS